MSEVFPLPEGHGLIRRARRDDLPEIVRPLGRTREALPERYYQAIEADPHQFLAVVEQAGRIVGTFQLSLIPGMSLQGAWRAQIEAVRIDHSLRNQGLGRAVMGCAIEQARRRGCTLVELTTHKSRRDAHRFYQRLGFISSHEGMKLKL
ncbi:MAG: GNAT family N-acetyltransferase [Meiothermus sp.]|uniref:GNAT family N-acetyltransferase n=1 Tax=Meiothermus sp. TaxID=1955249 RepID=UPI0028CF928F|nr:GNAT family N-acetyltransferase [Meiothermus sp.]MDT7920575.1 GNAT family N-acetyltransferase [Meiothermus sp.]